MRLILSSLLLLASHILMAQSPESCERGIAALQHERYADAIQPLSHCLHSPLPASQRNQILQMRAQAYAEQGHYKEAVIDQQRALAVAKPDNAWPLIMLGVYFRGLHQYQDSLAALRQAEGYDEDGPGTGPGMAVWYHMGWTLQEMGEHRHAIDTFTKAIPKQPTFGWVYYRRALSYEALGKNNEARKDMANAYKYVSPQGYDPGFIAKLEQYGYTAKKSAD